MMFKLLIILAFITFKVYRGFVNAEKIICRPPNKFCQVFAPPGTGKTTLAAKIVKDSMEMKKDVYSNVPIIGAKMLDLKDLGQFNLENCTLIIDEAGVELSNRNWMKNLNENQIRFLKKHRHYNVDIYVFSQAYDDIDNKFRELTTLLLMLKKGKTPFKINAIAIHKTMDLIGGQIVEYFEEDKASSFSFYNPKLWAYFNSYDKTERYKNKNYMCYTKLDTIK